MGQGEEGVHTDTCAERRTPGDGEAGGRSGASTSQGPPGAAAPPTALDQRGSGERIPPRSLREGPALPDALAFWLLIARRSCEARHLSFSATQSGLIAFCSRPRKLAQRPIKTN